MDIKSNQSGKWTEGERRKTDVTQLDRGTTAVESSRLNRNKSQISLGKSDVTELEMDKKHEKTTELKTAGHKLRESFDKFAEDTTLHGLRNVCSVKSNVIRKIAWLIILCGMAGVYFYIGSVSLLKYFSRDSITKLTTRSVTQLRFPAVSVCDQNLFSRSVLEAHDGVIDWIPTFHLNDFHNLTTDEHNNATRSLHQVRIIDLVAQSSLRNFYSDRIFVKCRFDGEPFNCKENFEPLITESALCYTFQSEGKVESDGELYSSRPGYLHGLGKWTG